MIRGSVLAIVALALALPACDPFGLPATRALEGGAGDMLSSASSYEISGSYSTGVVTWKVDLQLARPSSEHILLSREGLQIEALIIGRDGYFRGQQFMASRLGQNPDAPGLVQAAGNAWWKDTVSLVPSLPDFTDGATFRATFLGSAVTKRTDHQPVGGVDAIELSGARADVFIAGAAPYHLLRVHLKPGVEVDGLADADLTYANVDKDFGIAAPKDKDVIDFANLSTLPPVYTVLSVDTSRCAATCVVSARIKNLGGLTGAKGPSEVDFVIRETGKTTPIASCTSIVQPDVGYNSTATVSCSMSWEPTSAATVTATARNPGRA